MFWGVIGFYPHPALTLPRIPAPNLLVLLSYTYELLSAKALGDSSPFSLYVAHTCQSRSFSLPPKGPIPVTSQWCTLTSRDVSKSLQLLPGALKPASPYVHSRSLSPWHFNSANGQIQSFMGPRMSATHHPLFPCQFRHLCF